MVSSSSANAFSEKIRSLFAFAEHLEDEIVRCYFDLIEWKPKDTESLLNGELLIHDQSQSQKLEELAIRIVDAIRGFLHSALLPGLLTNFDQVAGSLFKIRDSACRFEFEVCWPCEPYNKLFYELRAFLNGWFDFPGDSPRSIRDEGVRYLDSVLATSVGRVSEDLDYRAPRSDEEVYERIREKISFAFPSAVQPDEFFLGRMSPYRPHILLPEIRSAAAFTFSNNVQAVQLAIEHMAESVGRLKLDPDYLFFYSVYYADIDYSEKEFLENFWRNKMPKNWRFFLAIN